MIDKDLDIMQPRDDRFTDLVAEYHRIVKETDDGILIELAPKSAMKWLPKKFVTLDKKNKLFRMPGWAEDKYSRGSWFIWDKYGGLGYHQTGVGTCYFLTTELKKAGNDYTYIENKWYWNSGSGGGDKREGYSWEMDAFVGPNM